jgi:hypothetical protein
MCFCSVRSFVAIRRLDPFAPVQGCGWFNPLIASRRALAQIQPALHLPLPLQLYRELIA